MHTDVSAPLTLFLSQPTPTQEHPMNALTLTAVSLAIRFVPWFDVYGVAAMGALSSVVQHWPGS